MGVVGSVTTWCTHWLCWCCPLPSHTHRACEARGGGGCVWCGCHHHCAPFPPTTTTVCAAPPCPLCVCVLVVGLGTAAHCGGTHAGVALCLAPGHHTHLPRCPRLSPLSSLLPPNPPSHTHTNGTAHSTHTWRALCASSHPLTHTLVASLPTHPPHTLVGVRVLIHLLSCAITHTAQAQAWRLPGCFGVVVTTTTPLVPHTHTHTGTGGGRHGGGWWWACGHCVAATPRHPLALPATTHATSTTTHTMACCLFGTPCHSHHHHSTPSHTHHNSHCATMVVAIGHHAVHTHHTCHTRHTHQGQAQAWLWLLVWHHHHAGVGHSLSSLLPFLSTNPFLSLSLACTHTPSSPHQQHHPIHPLCVVCVLWEWTDGWTTLWLSTPHTALLMGVLIGDTIQPFHPPSPLSLCFCPPPTTTPSLFSAHHTTHTEEKGRVGMDLLVLWVCDGWCGWHVWFVGGVVCWLCFAWLAHPITLSTPNHHHSPLFLSLHHPTLLSLCVEKGVDQKVDGVEWSVVCGMQHISHCAFIKPSPTPVCLSSFTIPFSLSNSFSSSLFVWFVWTERVKDKCGTHHVKHTVHHIQSTPHSFHPITPPFSMSTWLIGL